MLEQRYNIDHLVDPDRPGYLRRGVALTGAQFFEAARRKLKRWDGTSIELIHPTPDPIRAAVRAEIPEEMRKALEEAERKEQEAYALKDVADKKFAEAETALRKFWDAYGPTLTEGGWQKQKELEQTERRAERDFHECHNALSQAISERVQAENRINAWINAEVTARSEAARQAEEAKTAVKAPTLAERLRGLAQRLTA